MTKHLSTPQKNQIVGAYHYCRLKGIKCSQRDLVKTFKPLFAPTRHQVRNALDTAGSRQPYHLPEPPPSGPDQLLSKEDLDRCERLLENYHYEGHHVSWGNLLWRADIDSCSAETLRRNMRNRGHSTYIAESKEWISTSLARSRVRWALRMLMTYPRPEDWRHVRWSDEVHFGWDPEGKAYIIRKRGNAERRKPDCIQVRETYDDMDKNQKRVHLWGAIWYNNMSPLIQYEVHSNSNDKMNQDIYCSQILPVVKDWVEDVYPDTHYYYHPGSDDRILFALEEDNDSGHGVAQKNNKVERMKQSMGLSRTEGPYRYFFNHARSPDFAPIENVWSPLKQYIRQRPHWSDEIVAELCQERWQQIREENMDWINALCDSVPERLENIIFSRGQKNAVDTHCDYRRSRTKNKVVWM